MRNDTAQRLENTFLFTAGLQVGNPNMKINVDGPGFILNRGGATANLEIRDLVARNVYNKAEMDALLAEREAVVKVYPVT